MEDHAFNCTLELPGGRRVEVGITVIEDPLLPTPNEPDIQRAPGLHEWPDLCEKLTRLDLTIIPPASN